MENIRSKSKLIKQKDYLSRILQTDVISCTKSGDKKIGVDLEKTLPIFHHNISNVKKNIDGTFMQLADEKLWVDLPCNITFY